MGHTTHSGVLNPTSVQVRSPKSFSDYDPKRRIKVTLWITTCIRSDIERWLHFLRECGILRPHEEVETMVLTNSESEDEDNLYFLQTLIQVTTPTCHKQLQNLHPLLQNMVFQMVQVD